MAKRILPASKAKRFLTLCRARMRSLAIFGAKVSHVLGELGDLVDGDGVVERGADAADAPVPVERHHSATVAAGQELLLELAVAVEAADAERDDDAAAVAAVDAAAVEAVRVVDGVVDEPRLHVRPPLHLRHAALRLHPLQHQARDVDAGDIR